MDKMSRITSCCIKWTDKDCPRHKHDFSERVVIEVNGINYGLAYKCKHCRSFKRQIGVSDIPPDLPVCRFTSSHKYNLALRDLVPEEG